MALATIVSVASMALGVAGSYDADPDTRTAVVTVVLFILGVVGGTVIRARLGGRFPPSGTGKLSGLWW